MATSAPARVPTGIMPTTVSDRRRGIRPNGDDSASGKMISTRSPTPAASSAANSLLRTIPQAPGCNAAKAVNSPCSASVDSGGGTTPRSDNGQSSVGPGKQCVGGGIWPQTEQLRPPPQALAPQSPIRIFGAGLRRSDRDVWKFCQNPVAQGIVKTVHYREHHDQHGNTDGERGKTADRNQRKQAIGLRSSQHAQAEKQLRRGGTSCSAGLGDDLAVVLRTAIAPAAQLAGSFEAQRCEASAGAAGGTASEQQPRCRWPPSITKRSPG